jgi:eukaryotic-like serine/threonine-protein kinase
LVNYNGNFPYGSAPRGEYRQQTTDVGTFPPNAFGLYDMHGNVWEWCLDDYVDNYNNAPTDDSAVTNQRSLKVVRGGSWLIVTGYCRCASRNYFVNGDDVNGTGFRVVRVPPRTL